MRSRRLNVGSCPSTNSSKASRESFLKTISDRALNWTGQRRALTLKQSASANGRLNTLKSSTKNRVPSHRSPPCRTNGPLICIACRTTPFSRPPTWFRHLRARRSSSSESTSQKARPNYRKRAAVRFSSHSPGRLKDNRHGRSTISISHLTAVSASRVHPFWPAKNSSPLNGGFAASSYGIFRWRIILQETPRPPNGARIF